jgi:hypothetical protein
VATRPFRSYAYDSIVCSAQSSAAAFAISIRIIAAGFFFRYEADKQHFHFVPVDLRARAIQEVFCQIHVLGGFCSNGVFSVQFFGISITITSILLGRSVKCRQSFFKRPSCQFAEPGERAICVYASVYFEYFGNDSKFEKTIQ